MSTLVSRQYYNGPILLSCACVHACVCVRVCVLICAHRVGLFVFVCRQEKSQLDWNRFKAEEGLEHELTQQRKDGSV